MTNRLFPALPRTIVIGLMLFGASMSSPPVEAGARQGYLTISELESTIWVARDAHRRVTISNDGDLQIKEGKNLYIRFLQKVDDIVVFEIRWWNASASPPINVVEHGVMAQVENNVFEMVEADHMVNGLPDPTFVGIIGHGWFELIDHKSAKLVQLGRLVDGSASGFTTLLEKADALPEVPVEQTYPRR